MNGMADKIRHSGIVDSVSGDCIKVRILQTSACASCKVAGYCNASESKEKIVDVFGDASCGQLQVGDRVVVTASRGVAMKALALGFGVPFLILVIVLFSIAWITADETIGALVAMAALVPYYFLLYLMRGKMRSRMTFSIEADEF